MRDGCAGAFRNGHKRIVADNTEQSMSIAGSGTAWAVLLLAGLCEVAWAVGLKYTEGWTRVVPSVLTLIAMVASVVLLAWAIKHIPLGTAYAVWTGIGAVGVALLGIVLFGESRDAARLAFIGLIVVGIVGLKMVSPGD
jgi:quaternary ammonium compound-resistance protein SugE